MKKLLTFLVAFLMLSVIVSAAESTPDANGNVVCSGQYITKYNPEKLNAIMAAISDSDLVSEDTTDLVACEGTGMVRMDYRPGFAEGHLVEFARIYGTVTAIASTNKIEISDGALLPLEFPEDRHVLYPLSIRGNTITLQLVTDAMQKIRPLFRAAGNPSYSMESIFFGCQKKDETGRELSCSMSGQLYNEGNTEKGQLTIAGYGFVSAKNAFEAYDVEHAENIQELKEKTEVELESDFVAIPLTGLKEIRVSMPDLRDNSRLDLYAKAQAETSAIDSVRIKSAEEIKVSDLIENYKPKLFDDYMGKIVITGKGDIRAIINSERQAQGIPFMISPGPEDARVSVYMSGSKLVESTGSIYVFAESAEDAYNAINEDMALETDSILLKPGTNEIRIHSVFSAIDAYLLTDYNTVTIVPQISGDITESSVKVTNTRNGAWILYEDDELTWTPGKTIAGLGFNFNVNLNPAMSEDELLRCTTDGICWLGSTMVVNPAGLTQEKLDEGIENIRSSPRPRVVEEGAKGIGGCNTERDCDSTQRCLRGRCVEEETECIDTRDCTRGEICDRGQCLTSEEALGAKTANEIPPFGCEADFECKTTEKCVEGECLKPCTDDLNCFAGMVCSENYCRTGCRTRVDCFEGQECVNGLCERQVTPLPPFSEDAKAAGEGVFARAWDWTKGLFGAKTTEEENACDAAGGICRDICYSESEEASTSRSAIDACFLTPIADQPIETRKCCIPKEREPLNDCTILSGTCKSPENCDTSRGADWPWQDDYQGSESIVMGRDANEACGSVYHRARPGPVGKYRRSRGDICCVPLDICPDIEGIGGCSTA